MRRTIRNSSRIEVRESEIHGRGVFATKPISAGTYIIEYLGERISDAEAERRDLAMDSGNHTFYFYVSPNCTIDGGVNGNDSRFLNHSCDGNCKSEKTENRVFIVAKKHIAVGEELTIDYNLYTDEEGERSALEEKYRCFCGSNICRGTMLESAE